MNAGTTVRARTRLDVRLRDRPVRARGLVRGAGRHRDLDQARNDRAAHRGVVGAGGRRARREGLLRPCERARRRRGQEDRALDRRRRRGPRADARCDARARPGRRVRDRLSDRNRAEPRGPRLPERGEGAAALRRVRGAGLGDGSGEVPVVDRLSAQLAGGGRDLRAVRRGDAPACEGRCAPSTRRRRRGGGARRSAARPRPRGLRRCGGVVSGHGDERSATPREAEGVRRDRCRGLRIADRRDEGLRRPAPAGLEATRARGRLRGGREGRAAGLARVRVPQEPHRPTLEGRPGDEDLSRGAGEVRRRRERARPAARARDGGGVRDGLAPAARRREPDACGADGAGALDQERGQPVPPPRDRGAHVTRGRVPGPAGPARSLAERPLAAVRRPLVS